MGLYLDNGDQRKIMQLTEEDLTKESLIATLSGVQNLFTYNGNRFDLPFIQEILKINIEAIVPNHHDLIYDCWRCNLYGGLKETEKQLNIHRKNQSVSPVGMVNLLRKYHEKGDRKVIAALLEYNRQTMMNLKIVRALNEKLVWRQGRSDLKNASLKSIGNR